MGGENQKGEKRNRSSRGKGERLNRKRGTKLSFFDDRSKTTSTKKEETKSRDAGENQPLYKEEKTSLLRDRCRRDEAPFAW